jgi:2-oxoglutarate ferredoxin oxidoreductase subunit beta
MKNLNNYRSNVTPTWCPGCNNYIFYASLQNAFSELNIQNHQLVINFDIGCAGNMADFLNTYGAHTLHGRSVAMAMGEKIVNPELTVCVIGGDGGIYGEGLNHLIAAARANSNIKVFVSNNFLYSLTTGQTSPTTPKGSKTKSTPTGNINEPIDAVALLKTINPNILVESADSKNPIELGQKIKKILEHKGFALLDIKQQCIAFGKQLES